MFRLKKGSNTIILCVLRVLCGLSCFSIFIVNCAYFNTFYNAEHYYKEGLQTAKVSPDQAKESFKKAQEKAALVLKRWPTSRWVDDAFYLIALSYYHEGDYTQAVKRCDDFLLHFPKSGYAEEVSFYKGLALTKLKDYPKALTVFEELARGSKRFRERSRMQIARTYLSALDYSAAIESYLGFIEKYPRSPYRNEAVLDLANSYYETKDYAHAIRWYGEYLKKAYTSKEKAQIYLKLARSHYTVQELKQTEAALKNVIGFYPELEPEANLLLGKSLLAGNKKTEAMTILSKVGGGEFGAEAYYLIGKTYEEDKDFTKARAYYDSTRQKAPNSDYTVLALKRRALLELVSGDTTTTKDQAEAQFHLAEVYLLNLNQPEKALAEYEKVSIDFPKSPYAAKALFARAWVLENILKQQGSTEIYEQIVEKYPNTEYARKAAENLKKHETPPSPASPEEKAH
jgi:TolA-binding protein